MRNGRKEKKIFVMGSRAAALVDLSGGKNLSIMRLKSFFGAVGLLALFLVVIVLEEGLQLNFSFGFK